MRGVVTEKEKPHWMGSYCEVEEVESKNMGVKMKEVVVERGIMGSRFQEICHY